MNYKLQILSFFLFLFVGIFSLDITNAYSGISFCFFYLVILFNKNLRSLRLTIFLINILFNLILNRIYIFEYGEPYFMGGSDDKISFEETAMFMLEEYSLNLVDFISNGFIFHNSILYVYVVALLMKIGELFDGYYTIVPIFLNSFILTLTAAKFYKICHLKFNLTQIKSTKLTYVFAFFPLVMFMNSHVFRDTLVNYLIISMISIVLFKSSFTGLKILLLLLIMFFLRIEYVAVFASLLLSRYIFLCASRQNLIIKLAGMLSIVFGVTYLLFEYSYILSYTLENIEMYDRIRIEKGNPLVQKIFSLPPALRIPAKFVFLLLNPSPSFGTIEQMFIGFGTIIQVLVTPWVFYGVYLRLKQKDFIALLFVIMFLVIGLVSVDAKHKYTLIMLGVLPTYFAFQKLKLKF